MTAARRIEHLAEVPDYRAIRARLWGEPAAQPPRTPHPAPRPFQGCAERALPVPAAPVAPEPSEPAPEPAVEAQEGFVSTAERIAEILRVVCAHYGVGSSDVRSTRRGARVVLAKHVAMWITKQRTLRSLPDIGRRFGGRDHTTVLHAVRKVDQMRDADPAFTAEVDGLVASLNLEAE